MARPVGATEERTTAPSIRTLGIDPGVSGAVACIDPSHGYPRIIFHDLPRTTRYNGRNAIDPEATLRLLNRLTPADGHNTYIGLEAIHAMPGNGSITVFSQGHSMGTLETLLGLMTTVKPWLQIRYIDPGQWKRHFLLAKATKEQARHTALDLFGSPPSLQRKRDHNRAEAALIALFVKDMAEDHAGS